MVVHLRQVNAATLMAIVGVLKSLLQYGCTSMVLQKLVAFDAASQVMGCQPQLISKGMDFTDAAQSLFEHMSHCAVILRYMKTEGENIRTT